jgi:hypothetical protein
MAEKSALELLLASAPQSELRRLPMSLPAQINNPGNMLASALAEEQTRDRRAEAAKVRFAKNRYLATGDKAKALGFTPQMSMQLGGQQSVPVSPMFEPGADVGAMTAALRDRPLLTPVLPEQQLTAAELAGHRYGPGYEGRYYQPGNVGAVENLEALQHTPVLFADGVSPPTAFLNKHPGLLADPLNPTLPANVQRAGIQTELLPLPPSQQQTALLEPVDPGLEPPSDVVGPLPMLDQPVATEPVLVAPGQQMAASALASPEVPGLLDRRQLMAENLPPDIAYPEERVTPKAPPAVPITPVSTDGILPAPGVGPTKAAAGIVDPLVTSTPGVDRFLEQQTNQQLRKVGVKLAPPSSEFSATQQKGASANSKSVVGTNGTIITSPELQRPINTANKAINDLDKTIQKELVALTKQAPADSTMPFWNWLSDFSAGLRAAGKKGDQTLGAIADGFANVRAKAKERAATQLAARKISIENLESLGKLKEDLVAASATAGGGNPYAQSLFSGFGEKNEVFGTNGVVPNRFVKDKLGLDERYRVSYSINSKGVASFKQWKPEAREMVTLYPIGDNGQITRKPVRVVQGSNDHIKKLNSGNFDDDKPDAIERPLTDEQLSTLGFTNETISGWKNSGQIAVGEILPSGQIGKFRVQKQAKDDGANFMNVQTGEYYYLNKNDARHMRLARENRLVETKITQPGVSKSVASELTDAINSSTNGIGIIDQLAAMKSRLGEENLLGVVGRASGTAQNFVELIKDLAGQDNFIGLSSFASTVDRDFDVNDPLVTEPVRRYFDFKKHLAAVPFLKQALVYQLARTFKQGRKLNMQDVNNAKEALGFEQVTGEQTVFVRLEQARKAFAKQIRQKQNQMKKITAGRLVIPGVGPGPTADNETIAPAGIVSRPDLLANQDFGNAIPTQEAINALIAAPTTENIAEFNARFGKDGADVATFIFNRARRQSQGAQ